MGLIILVKSGGLSKYTYAQRIRTAELLKLDFGMAVQSDSNNLIYQCQLGLSLMEQDNIRNFVTPIQSATAS